MVSRLIFRSVFWKRDDCSFAIMMLKSTFPLFSLFWNARCRAACNVAHWILRRTGRYAFWEQNETLNVRCVQEAPAKVDKTLFPLFTLEAPKWQFRIVLQKAGTRRKERESGFRCNSAAQKSGGSQSILRCLSRLVRAMNFTPIRPRARGGERPENVR